MEGLARVGAPAGVDWSRACRALGPAGLSMSRKMELPMTKRLFAVATFLCVLALTLGWQARTQTEPSGKAVFEAYVSAWNRRDFAALDKLLAADAVHEDLARPLRDVGPAQIGQSIRTILQDHPDLNWHVTSIVDGGSLVAAEWVWTGTVTGEGTARPAPRRVSGRGASVVVIEKGRIKRFSDYYDFDSIFR